jgi:dihydrofolate reductase
MRISAIVAMSQNRAIGKNNQLPWHLPADLKHFKQVTMGRPILMGRKTYESIGRPLPGRYNIVITRDANFQAPGCLVTTSIDTALAAVAESDEIFIIGGALLYQQMMPRIHRLYLTVIQQEVEGDAFFPELDLNQWYEIERVDHSADEKNPHPYSFIVLDKKNS